MRLWIVHFYPETTIFQPHFSGIYKTRSTNPSVVKCYKDNVFGPVLFQTDLKCLNIVKQMR